jgi:hypothetical protein
MFWAAGLAPPAVAENAADEAESAMVGTGGESGLVVPPHAAVVALIIHPAQWRTMFLMKCSGVAGRGANI